MRPELQDIVDDVSRLLLKPVTLEDRNFNLVTYGSHEARIDEVRQQSILRRHSSAEVQDWFEQFGIASTEGPLRTPSSPELGVLARLCLPVRWRGVTYGYLWLLDEEHEIDEARIPEAMTLAARAGALMAQQARTREDLGFKLQDLLSADSETAERTADELDELGIIRRRVPVAVIDLHVAASDPAQPVSINLLSLPRSVLATSQGEHTTLLVSLTTTDLGPARDVARQARDLYAERLDPATHAGLVAGIGAPRPDPTQARESWNEARLAARVGEAVPGLGPVVAWPELGVYRLLACGSDAQLAAAVLDPAALRLIEHADRELRDTARAYFDHGGNVQRTAAELNVHRQTVYYRLQRIEQVTGLDLSRGDQRLLLHLGLTMAPLLTRSGDESR